MIKEGLIELSDKIVASELPDEQVKRMVDSINRRVESMGNYIVAVCNHEIGTATNKSLFHGGRLSQDDYKFRLESLDMRRRTAHENAMASIRGLNALCDKFGVPHICPDTNDRWKLGNFCAEVTEELFMSGTGKAQEKSRDPIHDIVGRVKTGESIGIRPIFNGDAR